MSYPLNKIRSYHTYSKYSYLQEEYYLKEKQKTKISKTPRVAKPSTLAEARGQLGKGFLDVLDIILSQINERKDCPENLVYEINIKDYADKFGLAFDKNVYRKLRREIHAKMAGNDLISIIDKNGSIIDFHPIQEIVWKTNGTISVMLGIRFKNMIVKTLEDKKSSIIYYALPTTLMMNSKYSKKMYPILLEHVYHRITFTGQGNLRGNTYTVIQPVEKFKSLLSTPKGYKTSDLKNICNTICDDIIRSTGYNASVEYNETAVGPGRPKTTHICWRLVEKDISDIGQEKTG